MTDEKIELIKQIQEERYKQRNNLLRTFIPDRPDAVPFKAQIDFFSDTSKSRLIRGGNRTSKSFSNMRDLAWMLTRSHPYRQDWNVLPIKKKNWQDLLGNTTYEKTYLQAPKKDFWVVGPTFEFTNGVLWGMYLQKMIPEWFIKEIRYTNQKNLDTIYFKNGDTLKIKTYSQQDTAKMGFSVDDIRVDEMCSDYATLSELRVRLFDRDGSITMGFTPLVVNQEIRAYLDKACEEGVTSLHRWTIFDNPLYRDNSTRLAEVLAEYSTLPENLRLSRLQGDWYEETSADSVFAGVEPTIVDDFEIPVTWRRARYTDPAANVTGHAEFAEDPVTGIWYCYKGLEITWGTAAKAEDILLQIEKLKPHENFIYCQSVYDNAEAWFGAYARQFGYMPCMEKNREAAMIETRTKVVTGKVQFFRHGAAGLVHQFRTYHFSKEGGKVVKKNDHILDCLMYFCRQAPRDAVKNTDAELTEKQYIAKKFNEDREKTRTAAKQPGFRRIQGAKMLAGRRMR